MDVKRRLLDQAMILFNFIPFQMATSLKGKNLHPEGAIFFPLRAVHYTRGIWKVLSMAP